MKKQIITWTAIPHGLSASPQTGEKVLGVSVFVAPRLEENTPHPILHDFPDFTSEDIRACLAFAADRERRLFSIPA